MLKKTIRRKSCVRVYLNTFPTVILNFFLSESESEPTIKISAPEPIFTESTVKAEISPVDWSSPPAAEESKATSRSKALVPKQDGACANSVHSTEGPRDAVTIGNASLLLETSGSAESKELKLTLPSSAVAAGQTVLESSEGEERSSAGTVASHSSDLFSLPSSSSPLPSTSGVKRKLSESPQAS